MTELSAEDQKAVNDITGMAVVYLVANITDAQIEAAARAMMIAEYGPGHVEALVLTEHPRWLAQCVLARAAITAYLNAVKTKLEAGKLS